MSFSAYHHARHRAATRSTSPGAGPPVNVDLLFRTVNLDNDDNSVTLDLVQILDSNGQVVAGAIKNPSFEYPVMGRGGYQYNPPGADWTFNSQSGISDVDGPWLYYSGVADGSQCAYLQVTGATLAQTISLPSRSSYQLRFYALVRNMQNNSGQIEIHALVNGQELLVAVPPLQARVDHWFDYTTPPFSI